LDFISTTTMSTRSIHALEGLATIVTPVVRFLTQVATITTVFLIPHHTGVVDVGFRLHDVVEVVEITMFRMIKVRGKTRLTVTGGLRGPRGFVEVGRSAHIAAQKVGEILVC
jgi:hypothetical protein